MRYPLACLFLLLSAASLSAEVDLRRGSVAVLAMDAGIQLQLPDERFDLGGILEFPSYFGGVFNVEAPAGSGVHLRTSNQIDIYFGGGGFFGIERFDKSYATGADPIAADPLQSRLIMNIRQGVLVVDSRDVEEDAQIVVETPFGRIYSPRALWAMTIEFDRRSRIYDFTITCAEGSLRLNDRQEENYSVFAGQRLAGAGSYLKPAIEIGEPTDQTRERIEDFLSFRQSLPVDRLRRDRLIDVMGTVVGSAQSATATKIPAQRPERRPVVIEYAPAPAELTPFRGVIPPPSDWQADIF